jgi:hypothetical protein
VGGCLPIVPLKLLAREGTDAEPAAELRADGAIVQSVSHEAPAVVMRIAGDDVLDKAGDVRMTCST